MRKLRKTIARYLILALTFCALTALPIYAGGPQGQDSSAKSAATPDQSSDEWLWELFLSILGL